MKRLFNISAISALVVSLCLSLASCDSGETSKTNLNISIEEVVGSVTETSVAVKVTTYEGAEGYYYAIGTAEDKDAFINGTLEGIKEQTDLSVTQITFDNLTPGQEYVVFAQAFAGSDKGQYFMTKITTKNAPKTEWDLAVSMKLASANENSINIKVESIGADAESLTYAIGKATDLESFKNGTLSTIKNTGNMQIKQLPFNGLNRGETYTVFAMAAGDNHTGEVATIDVRTLKLEFAIEIVAGTLTSTSVQIKFIPGGDVANYKYHLANGIEELELFEQGMIPGIKVENDVSAPKILTAENLQPGKKYAVMARPFADNGTRLNTFVKEFTTLTE